MKIIYEYPPVYDDIIRAGLKPGKDTVFAYGDAIYNPNNVPITPDLEVHEGVHMRQQQRPTGTFLRDIIGAKRWWIKYINDPKFRLEQEIEAYRAQFAFICKVVKDKNRRHKILLKIGEFLSGPLYGNLITKKQAMDEIMTVHISRPNAMYGTTTEN